MRRQTIVIGCLVAFAVAGLFVSLFSSVALAAFRNVRISGFSVNANLGLYSDSACTQKLTSIDWGALSPGGSAVRTVYMKNLGSSRLWLSLSTTNWNPSVANGLVALSWNREGATLAAGQVMRATLTLTVSPDASSFTAFNFDAVVTGEVRRSRF